MKPNATIVSLLTISESDKEKVFFIYCKEVNDISPSEIFWYPKYGKNGKADFLWEDKKIKQWVAIGPDKDISSLIEPFKTNISLNYPFSDIEINFELPSPLIPASIESDIYKIPGISKFEHEMEFYSIENWVKSLGNELTFLFEEETIYQIEGYKSSETIKPIFPQGLMEKGFLNKIKNSITSTPAGLVCVNEKRGVHVDFRGIIENDEDPQNFIGFVQLEAEKRKIYKIGISDENDKNLDFADINEATGLWNLQVTQPISKGKYYLVDKATNNKVYASNFWLLKKMALKLGIVDKEIKDLYNRSFTVTEMEKTGKKEITKPNNILWQSETFGEKVTGTMDLSDKLSSILKYLSPTILISDPYLLGDIKIVDDTIELNESQKVFINSLLTSAINNKIDEIRLLGYKRNFKKFIDSGSFDNLMDTYRILFSKFNDLKIGKVTIRFSKKPFHDRYWLNFNDNNKIFHISNSINGSVESCELAITYLDSPVDSLKVIKRLNDNWDNFSDEIIILE